MTIGGAAAAPKPRAAPFQETFSVTMMIGDPDQVVATNGSLQAIARCVSPNGVHTQMQILMRSVAEGWAATWGPGVNLPAGNQIFGQVTNEFPELVSQPGPNFIAVAPNGSFLAFGRDTMTAGVNVFGWDCIAAGVITRFTMRLEP